VSADTGATRTTRRPTEATRDADLKRRISRTPCATANRAAEDRHRPRPHSRP
jgi:hypothetical protein